MRLSPCRGACTAITPTIQSTVDQVFSSLNCQRKEHQTWPAETSNIVQTFYYRIVELSVNVADRSLISGRQLISLTANTWKLLPTVWQLSSRTDHASAVINGRVVVFGGSTDSGPSADVWVFRYDDISWTKQSFSTSPIARSGHIAVAISSSILWMFGGRSGSTRLNDVWTFSESVGWSNINITGISPTPRDQSSAVLIGEYVYIFGGFTSAFQASNELWRYHIANGTWFLIATSGQTPLALFGNTMVYMNNGIYIFGGSTTDQEFQNTIYYFNLGTLALSRMKTSRVCSWRARNTTQCHCDITVITRHAWQASSLCYFRLIESNIARNTLTANRVRAVRTGYTSQKRLQRITLITL